MKKMKMLFQILFFVCALISSKALAINYPCDIISVTECSGCKYSTEVNCNGRIGYAENVEPITQATYRVIDSDGNSSTVILKQPPKGIAEAALGTNSLWVSQQLAAKGIAPTSTVSLVQVTTATPLQLFADPNGTSPVRTRIDVPKARNQIEKSKTGLHCSVVSEPLLIKAKGCTNTAVCLMNVKCAEFKNGKLTQQYGDTQAACKATANERCPSATACASDNDVELNQNN